VAIDGFAWLGFGYQLREINRGRRGPALVDGLIKPAFRPEGARNKDRIRLRTYFWL
jgi:hypothetical protein